MVQVYVVDTVQRQRSRQHLKDQSLRLEGMHDCRRKASKSQGVKADVCADVEELWATSIEAARGTGIVESGDRLVITAGTAVNIPGSTKLSVCYASPNLSHPFCTPENFRRDLEQRQVAERLTQKLDTDGKVFAGVASW